MRLILRPFRDPLLEGGNLLMFGADQVIIQTPYQNVFEFGGLFVSQLRLVVFFTSVSLVALVTVLLLKTKTGKSVRAVAQHRHAAVLMGVNVNLVFAVTFNTIRLQILTQREEIEVSQLLGATDDDDEHPREAAPATSPALVVRDSTGPAKR